jgi:hypothetical protein
MAVFLERPEVLRKLMEKAGDWIHYLVDNDGLSPCDYAQDDDPSASEENWPLLDIIGELNIGSYCRYPPAPVITSLKHTCSSDNYWNNADLCNQVTIEWTGQNVPYRNEITGYKVFILAIEIDPKTDIPFRVWTDTTALCDKTDTWDARSGSCTFTISELNLFFNI